MADTPNTGATLPDDQSGLHIVITKGPQKYSTDENIGGGGSLKQGDWTTPPPQQAGPGGSAQAPTPPAATAIPEATPSPLADQGSGTAQEAPEVVPDANAEGIGGKVLDAVDAGLETGKDMGRGLVQGAINAAAETGRTINDIATAETNTITSFGIPDPTISWDSKGVHFSLQDHDTDTVGATVVAAGQAAENLMPPETALGHMTENVSQFLTGMAAFGTMNGAAKTLGFTGVELAKAAGSGAMAQDPHTENLSNLIQQYPSLKNPVTQFLAADPKDSEAVGRFKNAMDSLAMGTVGEALFSAVRAYKAMKHGIPEVFEQAVNETGEALKKAMTPREPIEPTSAPTSEATVEPAAPEPSGDMIPKVRADGKVAIYVDPAEAAARLTAAQLDAFDQNIGPYSHWIEGGGVGQPFIKVVMNIQRWGWTRTPGINLLQKELRSDLMAGGERTADAMAKLTTAGAIAFLGTTLAAGGHITGMLHANPAIQRQMELDSGNADNGGMKPNSWVITHEDGTKDYIPLSRFADPVGELLAQAATLHQISKYLPDHEYWKFASAYTAMIADGLADKQYFQGFANAYQAFMGTLDPEATKGERVAKFVAQYLSGYVPNILSNHGGGGDVYLREINGVLDGVMRKLPGFPGVDPVTNDLGERVHQADPIGPGDLSPFQKSSADRSVVAQELGRQLGMGDKPIPRLPKAITVDGIPSGIDTTKIDGGNGHSGYYRMKEIMGDPKHLDGTPIMQGGKPMPPLREALDKLFSDGSPYWMKGTDSVGQYVGSRRMEIDAVIGQYQAMAKAEFVRENPFIIDTVKKQAQNHRAVLQGKPLPFPDLLKDKPFQSAITVTLEETLRCLRWGAEQALIAGLRKAAEWGEVFRVCVWRGAAKGAFWRALRALGATVRQE